MTTIAPPRSSRVLAVTRLHFVNRWSVFVLPNLIMLLVLAVNIGLWAIIYVNAAGPKSRANVSESLQYSGAGFYIFVYMMVLAVQSIAVTFPFALGYGVTRRSYWAGTALSYVLLSAGYAIALTLLGGIEQLSDGWGFGGRMFTAVYYGNGPWFARFGVFFALMLFAFFTGSMFASVFVRWRASGLIGAFVILAVLVAGALAIVLAAHLESVVLHLLFTRSIGGTSTFRYAWLVLFAAIAALIGYLMLRRATPRS